MNETIARSASVVATLLFVRAASAQTAHAPEVVGPLAGPTSARTQPGLAFYGTDLGSSFVHKGKLELLFGDTWTDPHFVCEPPLGNDDSQATLPLVNPGGVPPVSFETLPGSPTTLNPIRLFRDSVSLALGAGQVPVAGFSDGPHAIAAFERTELVRCAAPSISLPGGCPQGLVCSHDVGECAPAFSTIPLLCDPATQKGCFPGQQQCGPSSTGFCVDPTSSQSDGTPSSSRFLVAHNVDFGVQRPAEPTTYDSVVTFPTNKFFNLTARTVHRFTGNLHGNDYRAGTDAVLLWGRPGFTGEEGRQAQLYFMFHELPARANRSGKVEFKPKFFAGLRGSQGEPVWSSHQEDALPLSLDGVTGGNPQEQLAIVNQMSVSYLGEPVNKWMMLYGGDLADAFLADPAHSHSPTGAIMVRFAENPWGPWSAPAPHLVPGAPNVVGDPYGPGGFLFHFACVDQSSALCARTDPTRPLDIFNPGCSPPPFPFDIGRLYGSAIIDAYTRCSGDGLDVFWAASTWNPYGVTLLKSHITP
jgi:hypothetical protein